MPDNSKSGFRYSPPSSRLPSSTLGNNDKSPDQLRAEQEIKRKYLINKQKEDSLKQRIRTDTQWEAQLKKYLSLKKKQTILVLLDAGGNISQYCTLENTGDLNSIIGNIAGIFSGGFERNQYLTKSVNLADKVSHIQLQNATKGLKIAGYVGSGIGTMISFRQMQHSGYSNQAIVRFSVDGAITIVGLINPYGLPIGFSIALVTSAAVSGGLLDNWYKGFDNTPMKR